MREFAFSSCPTLGQVLADALDDSVERVRAALSAGVGGYVPKSNLEIELLKASEALASKKTFFPASESETLSRIQRDLRRHRQGSLSVVRRLALREREVLRLLAEGKRNREVAGWLGICIRTVETHRAGIMDRLEVKTIGDLIRYAVRRRRGEPGLAHGRPGVFPARVQHPADLSKKGLGREGFLDESHAGT